MQLLSEKTWRNDGTSFRDVCEKRRCEGGTQRGPRCGCCHRPSCASHLSPRRPPHTPKEVVPSTRSRMPPPRQHVHRIRGSTPTRRRRPPWPRPQLRLMNLRRERRCAPASRARPPPDPTQTHRAIWRDTSDTCTRVVREAQRLSWLSSAKKGRQAKERYPGGCATPRRQAVARSSPESPPASDSYAVSTKMPKARTPHTAATAKWLMVGNPSVGG